MKIRLPGLLILLSLLIGCIAPQSPLAGIDIPVPADADESYYFFRAAKVVLLKQKDGLDQARQDLEHVVRTDIHILYPEAYPFLIEVYKRLDLSDSAAWVYPEALRKLETDPRLGEKFQSRFESWQTAYPDLPAEFTHPEYRLLDANAEPVGGYAYLYRILEYPEMAREMNRTGISWFSIIVKADGSLGEVNLLKSSYPDLDEAALAAIQASGWVPAKYQGRPVSFQIILPIHFRL